MIFDAIVVGGGIIGLSIGWRAAQLGLSVCVVDRHHRPHGASWVAAGMLAPVTEAGFGEQHILRLNIESARRWPGFATELAKISGIELWDGPASTLHVALDRDEVEALGRLFDYQIELGLQVRWLRRSELRDREPALHPAAQAAVLAAEDGSVDPRRVIKALHAALDEQKVTRLAAPVKSISGGPVPAVTLAGGDTIRGRYVVLAAGCWSALIRGAPPALGSNLRPVKGQILRLRGRAPLPNHVIRTQEVYIVPRAGGEVVVGATVEEAGFDSTATAGGVLELLRAADEVVPGIREMQVKQISAGLRPGSTDNGPLLGVSYLPGIILATGHYRNGILQAPVTADGIAVLLAGGEPPEELAGFEPSRFGC